MTSCSGTYRRIVALVLIPLLITGCHSWRIAEPSPADYLRTQAPNDVRVTRADGSQIRLRSPELRGDSLWGTAGRGLALVDTLHRVSLPIAEVRTLEVRQFSWTKTLGLVVAVNVVLALAWCASGGFMDAGC